MPASGHHRLHGKRRDHLFQFYMIMRLSGRQGYYEFSFYYFYCIHSSFRSSGQARSVRHGAAASAGLDAFPKRFAAHCRADDRLNIKTPGLSGRAHPGGSHLFHLPILSPPAGIMRSRGRITAPHAAAIAGAEAAAVRWRIARCLSHQATSRRKSAAVRKGSGLF